MPFERESFVPLLLSFVPQRVRRYSAFQFLRNPYIANLANFKDIEMGLTAFERESFVPVCTSITITNEIMIGTNKLIQTKYKRPAVLIFIFDKVERQVHIG